MFNADPLVFSVHSTKLPSVFSPHHLLPWMFTSWQHCKKIFTAFTKIMNPVNKKHIWAKTENLLPYMNSGSHETKFDALYWRQ